MGQPRSGDEGHLRRPGPDAGVGATYAWESKSGKVGSGRMEILTSSPTRIDVDLQFLKPFKAHNKAIFTFAEAGGETTVEWSMEGQNIFMAKVFGLFMDMEKMIMKDFEKGLAALKKNAEA
ncbi:MAG: SRPBCC family protein [bacterium]